MNKMSFSMELAKECIDIYQNVVRLQFQYRRLRQSNVLPSKALSFCNCFKGYR